MRLSKQDNRGWSAALSQLKLKQQHAAIWCVSLGEITGQVGKK